MAPLGGLPRLLLRLSGHIVAGLVCFQPIYYPGYQNLLTFGANVNTDMTCIEAEVLHILASHRFGQQTACFRGDKMVITAVNIQQGGGDGFQIDETAAQFFLALDQQVLLIEVLDEFLKRFSRDVGAVESPFLHA